MSHHLDSNHLLPKVHVRLMANKSADMTVEGLAPSQRILSAVSALRNEGKFTDLILKHEHGEFKVHKIIVCTQSKVINKACTAGFEESLTGVFNMEEISYLEVRKIVDFFYNMSYDDDMPRESRKKTGPCISLLQLHARMFAHGDRYDIPGLRGVAAEKYSLRAETTWMPLEFLASISDVYGRTPASLRKLRAAACYLARKGLPRMLNEKAVATAYEKVLTEVPEFARDLLGIYVKAPFYRYCCTCDTNQVMEALQIKCFKCKKGM